MLNFGGVAPLNLEDFFKCNLLRVKPLAEGPKKLPR